MNTRLEQIDILRAIAITAVIIIHSISINIIPFLAFQPQLNMLISVDQLMRFCVPFFFAISGYLLASKYLHEKLNIKSFLKKRALHLIPAYLVWSAIIYFCLNFFFHEHNPYNIFQIIFFGRADYDLYFIPALFYMYLLSPIILFFYKKWPLLTLACSFVITADVILFTSLVQKSFLSVPFKWTDQQQYVFPLTWIFYFVLGIFLKQQQDKKIYFYKTIAPILLICSIPLLIFDSIQTYNLTGNLINATAFTRFPVLFYATAFIATMLFWQEKLLLLPKLLIGILAKIGAKSFSIYLFHTLVIRIVFSYYPATNLPTLFVFIVVVIALTFLTSAILGRLHLLLKQMLPFSKTVLP
jgi:surface polysaccharide O-acyltransferase-like enzyme